MGDGRRFDQAVRELDKLIAEHELERTDEATQPVLAPAAAAAPAQPHD